MSTAAINPLTDLGGLPRYTAIRAEHVEPAIRATLERHRAELATLLEQSQPTFASLVEPLERLGHELGRVWSPAEHLAAVCDSAELRAACNACRGLLADWYAELGQNAALYGAFERIRRDEGPTLGDAERKLLDDRLRDFRLAGVALPPAQQARYREIMQSLATLQPKFDENVLDSAQAFTHHATDAAALAGLPAPLLARAEATARERQLAGWVLTLDMPTYQAVMAYADDAALRERFYLAWSTRASDQGPMAGTHDNTALIDQILALRHELAQLLGYPSYADLSLATKMAGSVSEVLQFLRELGERYRPAARRDLDALEAFAGRKLAAWDVAYYAERLRGQRYSVSDEALRPYLPYPKVLQGLFAIAGRLYGLSIEPRPGIETWHPDAHYYALVGRDGREVGGFYLDPYARAGKRSGAWMGECIGRMRVAGEAALPVAHLVCNFSPPVDGRPALLTHQELVTLFHEFGHGLHHLLTQVDYPSLAGINGVPWDAVELPSQFMERYAWRPEALPLVSAHVDTGEPLPAELLNRLIGSRSFNAGLQTVRQLEFALFDFRLHAEYEPTRGADVARMIREVRDEVAVIEPPAANRFAQSFSHVFAGGYAAGYYSYKWAEVLAADAFGAFMSAGVFDDGVARRFRDSILAAGGSRDAMDAFVSFRGRKPAVDALLLEDGIAA